MATYNDYPKSATNNAKRALKYKADNPDNDCGTRVGWERANQLASRESISRDTIARMASFARHEQHSDVPYSEGCGGLMWDAWGGTSGINWAQRKLKEIDAAANSMQSNQLFAFASAQLGNVDRDAGLMRGVSLIQEGEAKGHEMFVDELSISSAFDYLKSKKRLKAYITHRGAIFEDRMGREIGYFENFRIEDDRLMADFQAFESFQQDESRRFNRLFELAEKMPEDFGLSIVFSAGLAWATPDGDVPTDLMNAFEDEPKNARFEYPSIRIEEVTSADFVDSPAANERGLFSQIDINPNTNMATLTKVELSAKVEELEAEKETLSARVSELEPIETQLAEVTTEKEALSEKLESVEADLSEKETALAEKTEAFDSEEAERVSLETQLEEKEEALAAEQAEVERLKKLIDGSNFRSGGSDDDYKPSKEAREKRISEYAAEKGIQRHQAVIELSRKEPELWKQS